MLIVRVAVSVQPVHARSAKLNNVDPGQYLVGRPLENNSCCKLGRTASVMYNIWELFSEGSSYNSHWNGYIHLHANTPKKKYESNTSPVSHGLILLIKP